MWCGVRDSNSHEWNQGIVGTGLLYYEGTIIFAREVANLIYTGGLALLARCGRDLVVRIVASQRRFASKRPLAWVRIPAAAPEIRSQWSLFVRSSQVLAV